MFRSLLLLVSIFTMSWVIRRIFAPAARRPQQPGPQPGPQPTGKMVRDRFCNTFIPESDALTAQLGGEQHFFCSEACRSGFLAQQETQRSAVS